MNNLFVNIIFKNKNIKYLNKYRYIKKFLKLQFFIY